jgi:hypothetical protein
MTELAALGVHVDSVMGDIAAEAIALLEVLQPQIFRAHEGLRS